MCGWAGLVQLMVAHVLVRCVGCGGRGDAWCGVAAAARVDVVDVVAVAAGVVMWLWWMSAS